MLDEVRGQPEELAASAVDDRDLQVLGDEHDSLAHVLERELQLLRLEPRPGLGPQNPLDREEDDQRECRGRKHIDLEVRPRAFIDLVFVGSDAHPQRVIFHFAQRDQTGAAVRLNRILECGGDRARAHMVEQLGSPQVLAESEAACISAAGAHNSVAANERDGGERPEVDLVVKSREMIRIERGY